MDLVQTSLRYLGLFHQVVVEAGVVKKIFGRTLMRFKKLLVLLRIMKIKVKNLMLFHLGGVGI